MEALLGLPVRGCSEPAARAEAPFPAEGAFGQTQPRADPHTAGIRECHED